MRGDSRRWLVAAPVLAVAVAVLVVLALTHLGAGRVAAPANTAVPTVTPVSAAQAPATTPAADPSTTPSARVTPRATATLARRQADFQAFAGEVVRRHDACDQAAAAAAGSFDAATAGGDVARASRDAQVAQDTCGTAELAMAALAVPDSLPGLQLADVTSDMFLWAEQEVILWSDNAKVLRHRGDTAAAGDAAKMRQVMQGFYLTAMTKLTIAAQSLQVPLPSTTAPTASP